MGVANGKSTVQASKEAMITEQTYYRWRKEYGGLQVDQARRLKELERKRQTNACRNICGCVVSVNSESKKCSVPPGPAVRIPTVDRP